jgi:hypothetical protein
MQPHFRHTQPGPREPFEPRFPSLPIVTPPAAPRSPRQKYGGLFSLGILGLVVLVALIGWFVHGAWELRGVWTNVYVLHDSHRTDAERVQAASTLSRDPRVGQRNYWEMSLRKPLPGLARYVLAEALTAEIVASDPRGYGAAVAKSPGWPNWLRLLLTRPLAYAAVRGDEVPRRSLDELSRNPDPALALWASFALAAARDGDPAAAGALTREADREGPNRELARLLLAALRAHGDARTILLDQATLWLRTHHPEASQLWADWEVRGPIGSCRNRPRECVEEADIPQ